jgi:hypothetical protein
MKQSIYPACRTMDCFAEPTRWLAMTKGQTDFTS